MVENSRQVGKPHRVEHGGLAVTIGTKKIVPAIDCKVGDYLIYHKDKGEVSLYRNLFVIATSKAVKDDEN